MNRIKNNELGTLVRAHGFILDHPIEPPNLVATPLVATMTTGIATMNTQGGQQAGGTAELHAGVDDRRIARTELRTLLREMSVAAKTMDRILHPTAAEIRMPRGGSYQALRDRAQATVEVLPSVKAAFVALDWPADFDTKLEELLARADAAANRKYSGLANQVGGTAALKVTAREAIRAMRKLDPIMRQRLKDDPGLLAAWNAATHVERPPKKQKGPVVAQVKGDQGKADSGGTSAPVTTGPTVTS